MAFDDLKTIRLVQTGAVLRLSLNRPDKLNAFTGEMHTELREVLDALQQGQGDLAQVRVLVLGCLLAECHHQVPCLLLLVGATLKNFIHPLSACASRSVPRG